MIEEGDRIEMVKMPHDPDPITPGTRGTVMHVEQVRTDRPRTQLTVSWDNERSLSVVIPPDHVRKVSA